MSPFFVSIGVLLPRLALRLHTGRTQPFFPFGWLLVPPLSENRTQGHTCVCAYWYFSIVKKGYVVYTVSRLSLLIGGCNYGR